MSEEQSFKYSRMDVCKRFISTVPHSMKLGIEVLEAGERSVRARMPWREDLVGNPDTGVFHGGAVFALMDQVGGLANACVLYPNFDITPTIDFRVDHLRAPDAGTGVICEAECYRVSRQVTFVRMSVYADNDEQELLTTGMATYMRLKVKMPLGRKSDQAKEGDDGQA